jgi:hypothetical protein
MADGCTPAQLLERLTSLGITAETVYHPAAPTCAEHATHVGHLGGGQAKQLFLRCSKSGAAYLVSCLVDTVVDLKGALSSWCVRTCNAERNRRYAC